MEARWSRGMSLGFTIQPPTDIPAPRHLWFAVGPFISEGTTPRGAFPLFTTCGRAWTGFGPLRLGRQLRAQPVPGTKYQVYLPL